MLKRFAIAISSIALITACSSGDDKPNNGDVPSTSDFSRGAMLQDWVDNYIEPGYANLVSKNTQLTNKTEAFVNAPSQSTLEDLRSAFRQSYIAWQRVAFLEVGPAENNNLRVFTNTYPANTTGIEDLIDDNDYLLNLLSNRDKQGYPAIDYVLNGMQTDQELIQSFGSDSNYGRYLTAIVERLTDLSTEVKSDWDSYESNFVSNDGSSANASVDKTANAFLLHYEKFYRNGKLRFPLGYNTGTAAPELLEATYDEELGKTLFLTATVSMQNFYRGINFDGTQDKLSFEDYLLSKNANDLNDEINSHFVTIYETAENFDGTFKDVLVNNRTNFLNLHDRVQEAVLPMKTEMMQTMNISTAYFDGDGD